MTQTSCYLSNISNNLIRIANYALRKTVQYNASSFPPEVTNTIMENFYVDDCLKSVPSEKEAVELILIKTHSSLSQRRIPPVKVDKQ